MNFIPELPIQEITIPTDSIKIENLLTKIVTWDTYEYVTQVMFNSGEVSSKGEAKRLIQQNGLKINLEKVTDINCMIKVDNETRYIFQRGTRRFVKLLLVDYEINK